MQTLNRQLCRGGGDACGKHEEAEPQRAHKATGSDPVRYIPVSVETIADLFLDSTAAGQLVAVGDSYYDGRLQKKGIPTL